MRKEIESAIGRGSLAILILALGAVVFFVLTLSRWGRFVRGTITYVVEHLASQSGISTNLLFGIVIIGTIPFFWAVAKYMHGAWLYLWHLGPGLRLYKSVHGMIIVAYVGLYFFAMFYVARNSIAYKYCAQTPEGLKVIKLKILSGAFNHSRATPSRSRTTRGPGIQAVARSGRKEYKSLMHARFRSLIMSRIIRAIGIPRVRRATIRFSIRLVTTPKLAFR